MSRPRAEQAEQDGDVRAGALTAQASDGGRGRGTGPSGNAQLVLRVFSALFREQTKERKPAVKFPAQDGEHAPRVACP